MQSTENLKKIETIYGVFFSWKGDLITEQLEKYSAHTRNELSMLRSFIRAGDNILDIGAHIGSFSIPFSAFNKKKGRIYSFEANPTNYALFVKNIQANNLGEAIMPIHAVVSAEANIEFSALLPDSDNSGSYYFLPRSEESEKVVTSINIDNWHHQLDKTVQIHLLKIDVEGAELSVLRSCQRVIQVYKPILYIEINKSALQRFNTTYEDIENTLAPLGYHYFRNIGSRNSDNDTFEIASLNTLEEGGVFFDLLAIHSSDVQYPKQYLPGFSKYVFLMRSRLKALVRRFTKYL